MFKKALFAMTGVCLAAFLHAAPLRAETDAEHELAMKTQNPIANLISVPFQYNQDYNIGPGNAMKTTLNIQPVIPIELNKDWIVISRTILPVIDKESTGPGDPDAHGLGDTTQSFFFSPRATVHGWIVGFGPVFYLPTASHDEILGSEKWGIGPTFVVLKQTHGFTFGMLANHISSFAGNDSRPDISNTYLQPFFTYTTKTYTSFSVNSESTYNWKNSQWTVPYNFMVSQLLKIGGQPLSLQLGYRYYADHPTGGPDHGIRFTLTFLFPK